MAARFRFSKESAAALGIAGDTTPDAATQRLGFPAGVKVTGVKADGDGFLLSLSGDGLDGEVTGVFSVGTKGQIAFEGFEQVAPEAPAATTTEG